MDLVLYYKYQRELGETGRLHYQGCMRTSTSIGLATAKKILGVDHAHMEIARDWIKLMKYCGKRETRVEDGGPWEHGDPGQQGKRSELVVVAEAIQAGKRMRELAEEYPVQAMKYWKGMSALVAIQNPPKKRNVKVFCLYGSTGCGKTRSAYDFFPDLYPVFCSKSPWFDGYEGQRDMLLDDFGPKQMCLQFLKRLLDRYQIMLPVKGGSAPMRADVLIITTNYLLQDWYPGTGEKDYNALERRIIFLDLEDPADRAEWEERASAIVAAREPAAAAAAGRAPPTQVDSD